MPKGIRKLSCKLSPANHERIRFLRDVHHLTMRVIAVRMNTSETVIQTVLTKKGKPS